MTGWIRGLREQCIDAGVAFHFKQWGLWQPREAGGDGAAASFVRMSKKRAGRTLDFGVKKGVVPQTLWLHSEVGHTQDAKKELVSVPDFERSEDVFNTVKPTSLIRHILQIATDDDSIILDSFAGSGTTAHAVLALNKEDGGNRRFVLIECEDYVDSITAERVRRVIKGVPSAKDASLRKGLGGTFSYFKLGKPMRQESLLDGSNLPDYEKLASYLFFTATGEEFAPDQVRRDR